MSTALTFRICQYLLFTPNKAVEDPYILDEPEPAKCRATESSLWELMILERHYCKQISGTVKYFSEDMSKSALLDIEDFLDNTYSTVLFTQHLSVPHSAVNCPPLNN